MTLPEILDNLEENAGPAPPPPPTTDPFELVLWENVVYLADDGRRAQAFAELRQRVGTEPAQIAAADPELLEAIASAGIVAGQRAVKLLDSAALALSQFDGNVASIRDMSLANARRALRGFPSIGEPGADKILLFSQSHAVPSLESNGLRALQRFGLVPDSGNYSADYRVARSELARQLPADFEPLIRAYQLLRRHGQELCRRSTPACGLCPLASSCAYRRAALSNGPFPKG